MSPAPSVAAALTSPPPPPPSAGQPDQALQNYIDRMQAKKDAKEAALASQPPPPPSAEQPVAPPEPPSSRPSAPLRRSVDAPEPESPAEKFVTLARSASRSRITFELSAAAAAAATSPKVEVDLSASGAVDPARLTPDPRSPDDTPSQRLSRRESLQAALGYSVGTSGAELDLEAAIRHSRSEGALRRARSATEEMHV